MFDAVSKCCTISADTETLLKRMISLIPEEQSPCKLLRTLRILRSTTYPYVHYTKEADLKCRRFLVRFLDSVNQFLNGSVALIPENKNKLQPDVIDLFYLLADYYFKNKIMVFLLLTA